MHPVRLASIIEGVRDEGVALAKAAGNYLIGLPDPHDEDLIELVECRDEVPACYLTPVFLVHGFLHNWSGWLPLMAVLRDAGFARFVRFSYGGFGDSPEETAGALTRRVFEVVERTRARRIHFVGHSLGGVVVRIHAVMHGGDARLSRAVTLGAPLLGTPWGYLPNPTAFRELRPGSELVTLLANADDDRSRWMTVAGGADLVVPPRYAHLPGAARQVTIPGLGHVGLLYREQVWHLVRDTFVAAEEAEEEAAVSRG
jgi:pimeloyl-ACP methyl ester carboxylesterase